MEVRRLSDALLRLRISTRLPFLTPSVSSTLLRTTSTSCPSYKVLTGYFYYSRRPFACSALRQTSSSPAADTTDRRADRQNSPQPKPVQSPSGYSSIIDDLLDSTFQNKPSNRQTSEQRKASSSLGDSSSDLIEKSYKSQIYGQKPAQGSLAASMNMPTRPRNSLSSSDISSSVAADLRPEPATRATLTIRSRPSVGRTVEINSDRGVDLGKGFRSLDIKCALNNVRSDVMRQKFHERPGMKRKRLHRERWRKRFKLGFLAVVGKVKMMRRKGW